MDCVYSQNFSTLLLLTWNIAMARLKTINKYPQGPRIYIAEGGLLLWDKNGQKRIRDMKSAETSPLRGGLPRRPPKRSEWRAVPIGGRWSTPGGRLFFAVMILFGRRLSRFFPGELCYLLQVEIITSG